MWQVNWAHITIVNVEKTPVHTIASNAPPQEPILVYNEDLDLNLDADVDSKANYGREIVSKIEADEYERELAMKFEADDEMRRRLVMKSEPGDQSGRIR